MAKNPARGGARSPRPRRITEETRAARAERAAAAAKKRAERAERIENAAKKREERAAALAARTPDKHPYWPMLNAQQREIVESVWFEGRPLTVLGSAGTGKSFVIAVLIWLGAIVTAATAIAASAIPGGSIKTTHSVLGLTPDDLPEPRALASSSDAARDESERVAQALAAWRMRKNVFRLAGKLAKTTQCVLVVDEFGTLGRGMAALIDAVLRDAVARMSPKGRERHPYLAPEKPFAGVRVVFVGDPFQLEPVCDEPFFEAPVYQALFGRGGDGKTITLTQNYRQRNHTLFIHLLECLRYAWMTPVAWALLLVLEDRADRLPPTASTELYSTNRRVDEANARRSQIAKLNTVEVRGAWRLERAMGAPVACGQPISDGGPVLARIDYGTKISSKPHDPVLRLAVGAPVRFTRNLPRHPKYGNSVINGTIGRLLMVQGNVETGNDVVAVVLLPDRSVRRVIAIEIKVRLLLFSDGTTLRDGFVQLPLRIAFSMTVHGVQGVSMLSVMVGFDPSWVPWGLMYVALSRCTTLRNIIARGVVDTAAQLKWTRRIQRIMNQTGFDVVARRGELLRESAELAPQFGALMREQEGIDLSVDGFESRIRAGLHRLNIDDGPFIFHASV